MPNLKASMGERAYQETKDRILSGEMRGGQMLSEIEVATELGLSRTPVHEAFLRLAAEDLLDLLPRKGAIVVPVSPREAIDVLEMRVAIESAAVRRLCRSPKSLDPLLAALDDLVGQQRRLVAAGEVDKFVPADDAFHRCIVHTAGNPIAQRFYASLADRQRRMMAHAVHADARRLDLFIDEHAELAAAVSRREPHAFETALLAHLEVTYRVDLG